MPDPRDAPIELYRRLTRAWSAETQQRMAPRQSRLRPVQRDCACRAGRARWGNPQDQGRRRLAFLQSHRWTAMGSDRVPVLDPHRLRRSAVQPTRSAGRHVETAIRKAGGEAGGRNVRRPCRRRTAPDRRRKTPPMPTRAWAFAGTLPLTLPAGRLSRRGGTVQCRARAAPHRHTHSRQPRSATIALGSKSLSLAPARKTDGGRLNGGLDRGSGLEKRFGDIVAVDGISLEVEQRRGAGLPRPQRRRQVDHHEDDHGLPGAGRRQRPHRRHRRVRATRSRPRPSSATCRKARPATAT